MTNLSEKIIVDFFAGKTVLFFADASNGTAMVEVSDFTVDRQSRTFEVVDLAKRVLSYKRMMNKIAA